MTTKEISLPSTYSVEDWIRSTKGMLISAYMEFELSEEPDFTKDALKKAFGKVNRKRKLPVGENIREAIDIIKGKDQ